MNVVCVPRLSLATGADLIRLSRHFRGRVPRGLDPAGPWVNPDAMDWGAMRRRRYFGPWFNQIGSLSFDGVDDYIVASAFPGGNTLTSFAWTYPKSQGENGGRIYEMRAINYVIGAGGSERFGFRSEWSITYGTWETPNASATYNTWQSIAVTYDFGNTLNIPILYINTASQSLTTVASPDGIAGADEQDLYLGNRSGSDRTWDGFLGEFAWWNVILTANEIAIIHHLGPLAVPNGLQIYWPLWEAAARDFSGNARHGTVTGAVLAEDPPIPALRPSVLSVIGPPVAASAIAAIADSYRRRRVA